MKYSLIIPACETELRLLASIAGKSALVHIADSAEDADIYIVALPQHQAILSDFIALNKLNITVLMHPCQDGTISAVQTALSFVKTEGPVIVQWADLLVESYEPLLSSRFPAIGVITGGSCWQHVNGYAKATPRTPKLQVIGLFAFGSLLQCKAVLASRGWFDYEIAKLFEKWQSYPVAMQLRDFGCAQQQLLSQSAPKGTKVKFFGNKVIKQSCPEEIEWLRTSPFSPSFHAEGNVLHMEKLMPCNASLPELLAFATSYLGRPISISSCEKLGYIAEYANEKAIGKHSMFSFFASKARASYLPQRSHGDITPLNALKDANGKLYLIDPRLPLRVLPYEFELAKVVHGFFWRACVENKQCELTLTDLADVPKGILGWAGLQSLATPGYFIQDYFRYANALSEQTKFLALLEQAILRKG